MAIKFGMTIAQMIRQLTRGFKSVTGRDPDGLEKIKIQQEAVQRFKDMNKIVDMQGRTLDPSKTIMGGTQEGAALRSGIMKATGAKPKPVVKKENLKRQLTDNEIKELEMELGYNDPDGPSLSEVYPDFDGTVGSANKILKKEKQYMDDMFLEYKKGNLDPVAGDKSPARRKFLEKKLEEMEASGDKRLMTEDEIEELFDLQDDAEQKKILKDFDPEDRDPNAQGGRAGFEKGGMSRRKFMKIMGGLAALPIVGKFFKAGKVAAPAVETVKETVQQAPNYFFKLADKIRKFGKESRVTPRERVREINYKGKDGSEYTLTEDLTSGDMQITKDRPGMAYSDEVGGYDVIEDRTVMEYKSGKGMADETTGGKVADEYDEYKVEFDPDGTPADATEVDKITKTEIVKEVTGEAPSIKKAGGGIATMLGE